MTPAAYVPLLIATALAMALPRAAGQLPPPGAVRLMVVMGGACAVAFTATLAALAVGSAGRLVAVSATVSLALSAALTLRLCARLLREYVRARRLRRLPATTGGLVIVDDARPDACVVPLAGRIVVTTGMLRSLDAAQRRVLLAHERAHLRCRHHLYRAAAELAACLNPLLRPLSRAVAQTTERWADEEAAAEVGERALAAQAIAHAALATAGRARPVRADRCRSPVPYRVRALMAGPPAARPLITTPVYASLVANACATKDALQSITAVLG
ncbi:M56 family metallopeptidase [Actinomadura sp. ATCC 31491]|uniref:M56 family metallopeptidase n=1 Tax=Actinomadura luzonensis TaxID=2805427 RepID=A0ABT0G8Z9_9ACTN|nr:M56 family metallopeptidase [Actinomadura luzonensis]MCK2221077.1 M56 family metallopeptidase [Actinomadura luzonensis]